MAEALCPFTDVARKPSPKGTPWTDLWQWLGGELDGFGLDAPLYARCLLSILRQPPGQMRPEDGSESESEEDVRASELGVRRRKASVRSDGAPDDEHREAALLECLSTTELPEAALCSFVTALVTRYRAVEAELCPGGRRADESLDSGVCPSPDTDGFQNYDEAFPPLLDLPLPLLLGPDAPEFVPRRKSVSITAAYGGTRTPCLASGLPFTTQWTRPGSALSSCPGAVHWWGGRRSRRPSEALSVASVGGLAQLSSGSHHYFSATPPAFVVPRVARGATSARVGSAKLEFGYTRPPGAASELWGCLGSPADFDAASFALQSIHEDEIPPPPLESTLDWPRLLQPTSEQPAAMTQAEWETATGGDPWAELPSLDEDAPGFVVPRLATLAGADAATRRSGGPAEFVPIRPESLESAFVPPGSYALDYAGGEEWFILRDSRRSSRTRQSSTCSGATEQGAPAKRRRPSGSLPLKFQASKPAKMVQTEPPADEFRDGDWESFDAADSDWDKWRPEEEELPELELPHILDDQANTTTFVVSEGRRIVSLGAGSSIWESVPRTVVPAWADAAEGYASRRAEADTASEAADDDLLLSLVGGIAVNQPL